jgi:hypothetical protein
MFGLEMAVLRAGTPLFHGTRCAGDYGIPDGPAWFAYTRGSAAKWIDWSARLPEGRHPGERRVLHSAAARDAVLLDTSRAADWHRLSDALTGDPEADVRWVARCLAGKADGWMGRAEVMLCAPERWLLATGAEPDNGKVASG